MSEIKVNSIKGVAASSAAITISNTDGTCTANIPDKSNYNLLINGQFDIWQRATDSGSNTTDGYLAADRWRLASSGATKQVTRQSFTVGQTDVPSNPKYYLRYAVTIGNDNVALRQRIEGVDKVQGSVTLSFWAKGTNPAGGHFTITNRQDFGTGGSASSPVETGVADFTVTSSWVKKTFTFTPPSISGKTFGTNNNSYYGLEVFRQPADDTGTAAFTIDIANVKLEYGSYATDYQRINVGQELALCQRYYFRANRGADSGERPIALGVYENASTVTTTLRFADMRTNPTLDITDASDAFMIRRQGGSDNFDTFTLRYSTVNSAEIVSQSGQTSGNSGIGGMVRSSGVTTHLSFSAEL
jgi:hypothetical protein